MINLKELRKQIDQLAGIKATLESTYKMLAELTGKGVVLRKRKKRADAGKPRGLKKADQGTK